MKQIPKDDFEKRGQALFYKIEKVLHTEEHELAMSVLFSMVGAYIETAKGEAKIALQQLLLEAVKKNKSNFK